MQNELNKHKTSDSVKWVLTLIAFIIVGIMLAGIMVGWFNPKTENEDEQQQESSVAVDVNGTVMDTDTVYAMPKAMSFSSTALYSAMATSNEQCVSVNIEAYVWPEDASNTKVDYSVAWGSAPTFGSQNVTDFVKVSQASDGDTVATVSCYKAFGSDTIILTVTTRDGGFTDKCTISFVGTASEMNISHSTLALTNTTERGNYYLLGTGKTYSFDIGLDNIFNSVGSHNLTATLDATGSLYFGQAWSDAMSGTVSFSNITEKNLSEFKDSFVTVSISGSTLTVNTSSTYIENFYSLYENDDEFYLGATMHDRFVYVDEWGLTGGTTDYEAKSQENLTKLKSCYFTITVTDSVSGLSDSIKIWVEPSVEGVNLSESDLDF